MRQARASDHTTLTLLKAVANLSNQSGSFGLSCFCLGGPENSIWGHLDTFILKKLEST